MSLEKIYAHLSCRNLPASIAWFEKLFARAPNARPMDSLAEWHHADNAGFQLFKNAADAGHGTLTLIVRGLTDEHARLVGNGLEPGPVEQAATTSIVRLRDPDGNLVVLAEPKDS